MESRIQTYHIAERVCDEHIQLDPFVREHVAEATGDGGVGRAFVY